MLNAPQKTSEIAERKATILAKYASLAPCCLRIQSGSPSPCNLFAVTLAAPLDVAKTSPQDRI